VRVSHRLPAALSVVALLFLPGRLADRGEGHELVRGMTISCQGWGAEWGTPGFDAELEDLRAMGGNWVAIHPYASIQADGTVRDRGDLDAEAPPDWLARPLSAARERGLALLVKPHLAYWRSPFAWRGDITFAEPEARARFWRTYSAWIVALARSTRGADAFCVGTELDRMLADEAEWRALVARVRAVTDARLTYAANWDRYGEVRFWDALDAIGVQAYFPLVEGVVEGEETGEAALRAGWSRVLSPLRELSERTGKPVVFTELGYSDSPAAALRPWEDPPRGGPRAPELQARCLATALRVLAEEREWLRGAFLWKWFVGESRHRAEGFYLDRPVLRDVLRTGWTSDL